jgi:uncharacterized peroxidase-related enzyme
MKLLRHSFLISYLCTLQTSCMYLNLPSDHYGIGGLFRFSPKTAHPMRQLAEILLHDASTLSRADRELLASYVSYLNKCHFCCNSHSAIATALLHNDAALVEAVKQNPETAPISEKLKALLALAHAIQQGGNTVTPEIIARTRAASATDQEIHDTVLIAAAFCLFNRYVDGLGAWTPDADIYTEIGIHIAEHGYLKEYTKHLIY